jgi:hypothetical protein
MSGMGMMGSGMMVAVDAMMQADGSYLAQRVEQAANIEIRCLTFFNELHNDPICALRVRQAGSSP